MPRPRKPKPSASLAADIQTIAQALQFDVLDDANFQPRGSFEEELNKCLEGNTFDSNRAAKALLEQLDNRENDAVTIMEQFAENNYALISNFSRSMEFLKTSADSRILPTALSIENSIMIKKVSAPQRSDHHEPDMPLKTVNNILGKDFDLRGVKVPSFDGYPFKINESHLLEFRPKYAEVSKITRQLMRHIFSDFSIPVGDMKKYSIRSGKGGNRDRSLIDMPKAVVTQLRDLVAYCFRLTRVELTEKATDKVLIESPWFQELGDDYDERFLWRERIIQFARNFEEVVVDNMKLALSDIRSADFCPINNEYRFSKKRRSEIAGEGIEPKPSTKRNKVEEVELKEEEEVKKEVRRSKSKEKSVEKEGKAKKKKIEEKMESEEQNAKNDDKETLELIDYIKKEAEDDDHW